MTPADFARSMTEVGRFLHKIDIVQNVRSFHSLTPSDQFKRAALTAPRYPDLYLLGLERRDYNVLLTDFSYLQFGRAVDETNVSLRYAYYPNPFDTVTFDEFVEAHAGDEGSDPFEDYVQFLEGSAFRNIVPVIRYDYAQKDYREYSHPAAHFHFGLHADNRWAVSLVLTPFAFALQIIKMFYGDVWQSVDRTESSPHEPTLCEAKGECLDVETSHFTPAERRQLYFG